MRKYFALVLFVLAFLLTPAKTYAFSGGGTGATIDPFRITSCSQLMEMANSLSSWYVLTQDIDCNGTSVSPVGSDSTPFTGNLNGQTHKISNYTYSTGSSGQDVGLFGRTDGATISNLRMEGGSLSAPTGANNGVGSFVGTTDSGTSNVTTLTNVSSTMTITGSGSAAGFIGGAFSPFTISKSFYNGTVNGVDNYTGGFVGWILTSVGSNLITDSYTQGTLVGPSTYVGALIGYMNNRTTITRSYSSMSISLSGSPTYAGGLVGYTGGTVSNSFFAGTISGSATYKGAMFGYASPASISNVYFDSTQAPYACEGYGNGVSCNTISGQPNYFKNNSTNAPLNGWDFNITNIWYTSSGNFPLLYGFTVFPSSNSSSNTSSGGSSAPSTTSPPSCGDSAPVGVPDLFQVNTTSTKATLYFAPAAQAHKYVIAFGYSPGDDRFGADFEPGYVNGVISYTVNDLSPNTTYYFRIRGGHGCMPGEWGNTLMVRTTNSIFYGFSN